MFVVKTILNRLLLNNNADGINTWVFKPPANPPLEFLSSLLRSPAYLTSSDEPFPFLPTGYSIFIAWWIKCKTLLNRRKGRIDRKDKMNGEWGFSGFHFLIYYNYISIG